MGNSKSSEYDEDALDKFDGIETLGYRVLGVQPNSPASNAGLVSFFDFLVGANGQLLLGSGEELNEGDEYDDVDFPALLQEFKGRPLELLVWNIKSQQERLVTIVPNDDWGGAGLLGVTIRLDDYGGADERMIRVLSVEHQSPAAIAGLVALQDYLLGTTMESFDTTKVLADVLANNVDKVIELYVYNLSSDVVRVVALMPTWSWGGSGLLGAEVGTGYLHRLPGAARETSGSSVERKVRFVRKESSTEADEHDNKEQHLELEPHLEMEPHEDHDGPEEISKHPHQVADYRHIEERRQAEAARTKSTPKADPPADPPAASFPSPSPPLERSASQDPPSSNEHLFTADVPETKEQETPLEPSMENSEQSPADQTADSSSKTPAAKPAAEPPVATEKAMPVENTSATNTQEGPVASNPSSAGSSAQGTNSNAAPSDTAMEVAPPFYPQPVVPTPTAATIPAPVFTASSPPAYPPMVASPDEAKALFSSPAPERDAFDMMPPPPMSHLSTEQR